MANNIGILGSGMVAQALGIGFLKNGYKVKLGSRNPQKLEEWLAQAGENASVGSFEKAAGFGDMIVLACKGTVATDVLLLADIENLDGKIIMDATNPIADAQPEDGVLKFFTNLNYSLMEKLQSEFPTAHFVKAFNSVGSHLMVDPEFDVKPTMFIAGDHDPAKIEIRKICEMFGWEVEDMGSAKAARAIEPLCMLWCIPGFRENQWQQAFKFLKK